jgi:amino acid adenylation domain-containing protein
MTIAQLLSRLQEEQVALSVEGDELVVLGKSRIFDDPAVVGLIRENKKILIDMVREGSYAGAKSQGIKIVPNGIPNGCTAITPEMLTLVSLQPAEIERIVAAVPGGAANVQDVYPLGPLQEGLLFHHLAADEGDPYLLRGVYAIDTRERLDGFIRALQAVIDRHDILRTAVHWDGLPDPVQVVLRHAPLAIEELELDPADGDIGEQLSRCFDPRHYRLDVRRAPLLQLCIAHDVPNRRWIALLLNHHLAGDHTAQEILLQEVHAHLSGTAGSLPDPLPFRDFVAQALHEISREEHEAFFRTMLADVDESTAPYGLTDVHLDGSRIVEGRLEVDASLARRLRAQARAIGVSAASLFHYAWAQVLARVSGRDDVVFGTVLFGRMQGGEGVGRTLGTFINTLPLCIATREGSVREGVRATHARLSRLLRHEHAPLSLAQRCSGVAAPAPLFTSFLNYRHNAASIQHAVDARQAWQGIEVLHTDERTNYPFSLDVDDLGDGFALVAQVQTPISPERVCATMHAALEQLAAALEDTREMPSSGMDVVPADDIALLRTWSTSAPKPVPTGMPKVECIHEFFEARAAADHDAIAAEQEGRKLSYGELNVRANRLAHHLRALGVGPEIRVALHVTRSLDMLIGVLGVLKAGGAYVPFDPAYPIERLQYMLADCQPLALLTDIDLPEALSAGLAATSTAIIDLRSDAEWRHGEESNPERAAVGVQPSSLAYVIYTSGSTGEPKGVMVEHRGVASQVAEIAGQYGLRSDDCVLQFNSFAFDVSVEEIFGCLSAGAKLLLRTDSWLADADGFFDYCATHAVSAVDLPTAFWEQLVQSRAARMPTSLRLMIVGGEAISAEAMSNWFRLDGHRPRLLVAYGPTETIVNATLHEPQASDAGLPIIGRPLSNTSVYLLDRHGRPVPQGVVGEVHIGGAQVARGYLNRAELTQERFVADPFSGKPGARMYRTGDLARYLPDGKIVFAGRNDFQVKIRGFRVEPGEIEARMLELDDVREAAVLALDGGAGAETKRLVAYYTTRPGTQVNAATLRAALSARLPAYMLPSAFVALDALPLTPSGKLDRRALAAPDIGAGAAFGRDYEAPGDQVEATLTQIWSQVLGVERIGRNDDFFDLGGHSLSAVRVTSRIRQMLGVEVRINQLFTRPVLRDFADVVRQAARSALPPITPVERSDALVLSFAQQRLWFLAQMEGVSQAYHMPLGLRLEGALDTDALRRALDRIVARHEALRTTFVMRDGTPLQRIADAQCGFALQEHDLQSQAQAQDELAALVAQEAGAPFDLAQGPLIRGRLIRLADEEHVLLVTMHHIVSDGWSQGILINEFSALYNAYRAGRDDPLPVLAIQYADYAAWQRRWITGEVLQAQTAYWQQTLADAPVLLQLPTDHPRPAQQDYAGAFVEWELDAALTQGLKDLSARHGTTLFMTLLAGWATLLARLSGQDDVVIGTPMANRTRAEVEPLIGFFVNTLALRLDLAGSPTVAQLLQAVKARTLEAQQHQDLPFEQVVEIVNPPRSLAHSPLFQVMMGWNETDGEDARLHGLTASPVAASRLAAQFDLSLFLGEQNSRITGGLVYATALYERASLERYLHCLRCILQGMIENEAQAIDRLALLDADESRRVLSEWNATAVEYPRGGRVHEQFEEQAAANPHAVALVHGGTQLSYGELDARANRLARHLRGLGLGTDGRVALCMERGIDMVVGLLAVLKAGGAYVPLDPDYPAERLAFMLEDSAPLVLLTHPAAAEAIAGLTRQVPVIDLETDASLWSEEASDRLPAGEASETDLCYVIYTSGSTGRPKGVMNEHRAVVNRLLWMQDAYRLTGEEAVLQKTPFSFDVSVWEFFWPLLNGAKLVMARPGGHKDPAYLAQVIREQEITTLHFVPSMLQTFLTHPDVDACTTLRRIVCSGEALPGALARQCRHSLPQAQLYNLYGPTEAAVDVTAWACSGDDLPDNIPIGRPIANTRIYLLDANGQPVPQGVAGEIHIGGVQVARGYLNRDALTQERFLPDPFANEPGARMYKTGDLGRYLPDGSIVFLGRNDHQVKLRGFRIELGEIEAKLLAQQGIRDAVVTAREDRPGDKRLVAYLTADTQIDAETLRTALSAVLPEYMVPAAWVQLEALPLTSNGKLDRQALPAPEGDAYASRAYEAPQGDIETALASIWAGVLGIEQVGRHDNFFTLGGHSLLAVKVASRVRQVLGVELGVTELFAHTSLGALAAAVGQAAQSELPAIALASRDDPLPLSFAQQRLWFLSQMEGVSQAYHIPLGLRMQGALDGVALQRALERIVARHEALRTTFVLEHGQPVQRIAPADIGFALQERDLRNAQDGEAVLAAIAAGEAGAPFDLAAGPLVRGQLIRTTDDEHVLLVTMHHIVSDGWSQGILVNEFSALYNAYREGRDDPLPPLSIQYADYAAWQRRWIDGEVLQAQGAYWQQTLAGAPALLELPTDHARGAVQSLDGATVPVQFDAALTQGLKDLGRRHGTTLFMTLLAGWAGVLARLSAQDDIVIGTPVAGRTRAEVEPLMGLFLNTLALRIDLSQDPSAAELLQQVKTRALAAQQHQDLPFEQVVDLVKPERSLAHSPLFQVMFAWQNNDAGRLELPGMACMPYGVQTTSAKFDLTLNLGEEGDAIAGVLEYASALFERATVERMLGYLQRVLAAMVENDSLQVARLPLLDEQERHRLLVEWNAIDTYPSDTCLHMLFERQAAAQPQAIALTHEGVQLRYGELNARANRLARHLRKQGVAPDARVAICMERGLDMVVAILAVLKAGGGYVPLDPAYPPERLAFMLEDSAPVALLTHGALDPALRASLSAGAATPVDVDADAAAWTQEDATDLDAVDSGVTPAHLAYVIYTSGSTGLPKGVMVEHRNVARLLDATHAWFDFGNQDVWTLFHSFAFDFSVWELWGALAYGARLVVVSQETARAPDAFLALLCREGVTVLNQTPSAFRQLIAAQERSPEEHQLRQVIFGGEALEVALLRPWYAREGNRATQLVNMYGITETTVHVTYRPLTAADAQRAGPSPIGQRIPDLRIYLLDAHGQPVPQGAAGELYVGGAGVARGYLNREELTAERFLPDPFSPEPGARMYKTGDLGRYLADGSIAFLGRNDHQVKLRGFRIELGEIEAKLLAQQGIRDAVVMAREDRPGDVRLVAYLTADAPLDADALRAKLHSVLPEYMVPAAYVQLDALPLTPNGKLDRNALPAPEDDAYASRAYEAPVGEVETVLAAIWAEVLGVEQVGRHDHFFALGGHSLLAVTLVERMRQQSMHVDVRTLFATPTVAALAQAVSPNSDLVPIAPNGIPAACEDIRPDMLPLVSLTQAELRRVTDSVPGGASNVQDIYPLAPLQEGILFHHLMAGRRDVYVAPTLYRFASRQRLDQFMDALQAVVDRHDILRTAVVWEGLPEPVQVVWRKAPLVIEEIVIDPMADDAAEYLHAISSQDHYRLDVRRAPLMRSFIAPDLASGGWLMLHYFHHLVIDHTTLEAMQREIQAYLLGEEGSLPAPLPFRNFVAQARLGVDREEHKAFFSRMLSDVVEPTTPYGLVDVQGDGSGIDEAEYELESELAQALRDCARSLGVSVASLFHQAWAAVLARLSGSDDVVFGTVLFGRMQGGEGADRVLGLFMNTLPVRIRLDEENVQAAVHRTHALLAELLRHEHAPLTLAQRCSGVEAPTPLFSALLNYRHTPERSAGQDRQAWDGIEFLGGQDRTNYPLTFHVDDTGEGFGLKAQVPQSVDPNRVCAYMKTALAGLVRALQSASAASWRDIEVLPEQERRTLLYDWNNTAGTYQAEQCMHTLFERQAASTPDAIALVQRDATLSYSELNAAANRLAHRLRKRGVRAEARVALCMERSTDMVVAILAILKAGGAYVPLDPAYPPERLAFMLQDSAPVLVLICGALPEETLWSLAASAVPSLDLGLDCHEWAAETSANPDPSAAGVTAGSTAYVIYTSGSTGQPKGVMVEHRGICNLVVAQAEGFAVDSDSRVLQFASPSFDACVSEIAVTLCTGAALYIADPGVVLAGQALSELIDLHGITHVTLPPAVLAAMPDDATLTTVSTLVVAGDAASAALVKRWAPGRRLVNAYGPTEATVCAAIHLCDVAEETAPPIGRPIRNTRIYLLDSKGQPVPVGVAGEIHIGGVQVARGYLNRPELSAERFLPDLFAGNPNARMYRTGDLGRYRADGCIEFLGRSDFQVKLRGFRIEPGEIEARLAQHPDVQQAVVLCREDEPGDRRLVAYVVPQPLQRIELWPSIAEYFVYDDLLYFAMTNDERRNRSYKLAIGRAVKNKVVVEIGTGKDAILARFCVEAGARKVYAIELLEESYRKAKVCIEQLGLSDRITLIHGDATKVELPELADVCVSEIVGSIGGCEGAGVLINNAWRFMKDDGVMIPERTMTRIAAVTLPEDFLADPRFSDTGAQYIDKIFEHRGYKFDFRLCLSGVSRQNLISNVGTLEDLDHTVQTDPEFRREECFTITRDARIDGFLVWLNLYTAHDEVIDIIDHRYCWLPVYFPVFYPGIDVACGDTIRMDVVSKLCDNGINPDYHLSGELIRQNGEVFPFVYSSHHYREEYRHTPFYDFLFDRDPQAGGRQERSLLTSGELGEHLKQALPDYMVPAAYVIMDALPMTANGKLDRKALPAPGAEAFASTGYAAPEGLVEETLAVIWADVLKLERVGRHDHFFAMGGDSLLVMRVVSQLREILGIELSVIQLFEYPVLSDLARTLEGAQRSVLPPIEPADRSQVLVLSFAQQRLWFLAQMERASQAYHIPLGLHLQGTLDVAALRKSLDRVMARHEALRTTFDVIDGAPVQHIAPPDTGFRLVEEDLREQDTIDSKLQALIETEASAPFDLASGPLVRGRLVCLAANEHVLLITMHHIVSDGWSMGVLTREMSSLYRTFVEGVDDGLPPLSVQYADYAAWQRRWLSGEVLQAQSDYWRRTLAGAPTLLDIPSDRPRPAQQDYAGSFVALELDSELSQGLDRLSKRHGATLFMTLLGAWAILLFRLSGQKDLMIGTPVANRTRTEVEPLIGFFVNTLALRMDLSGSPSVKEMLERVKARALEAQQNQDLPFEQVVEIVNPPRSMAHNPLFQSLFTWRNNDEGELDIPGLTLSQVGSAHDVAQFDLMLNLGEENGRIVGGVEFASALFDQATVERYLRYLHNILSGMVRDEHQPVDRISLLEEMERRRMLVEWNATDEAYPLTNCAHELFEEQAAETPDAVALAYEGREVSYATLNAEANRLAHHLMKLGVGPETHVAVCMERGIDMVVGLLAVLKAGGAYVPLDPAYPAERLGFMVRDSAPIAVLTHDSISAQAFAAIRVALGESGATVIDLEADRRRWVRQPAGNPAARELGLSAQNLAYVIYTSGSTGLPKGVMIRHSGLTNYLCWARQAYRPDQGAVVSSSLSFDATITSLFTPLVHGSTVHLLAENKELDQLEQSVRDPRGCGLVKITPAHLDALGQRLAATNAASHASLFVIGGEALAPATVALWQRLQPGVRMVNEYGPTETVVGCIVHEIASEEAGASVPIGRPIGNTRIYLLDAQQQPVPVGVIGEIFIAGEGVARGYLNRPELTEERFIPDPFTTDPEARMYRTGDLARYRPDGTIEYLGRNDFQVKVRGFRIELGEIEARLLEHPAVREAAVILREDGPGDKQLVAYCVCRKGNDADPESLRIHLRTTLRSTWCPQPASGSTACR